MIGLYFDHHVPAAVVEGLRRRGVDVLTVFEDGYHERPDDELLTRATALERILFSQDTDLLVEAHRRTSRGSRFSTNPTSLRLKCERWIRSPGVPTLVCLDQHAHIGCPPLGSLDHAQSCISSPERVQAHFIPSGCRQRIGRVATKGIAAGVLRRSFHERQRIRLPGSSTPRPAGHMDDVGGTSDSAHNGYYVKCYGYSDHWLPPLSGH